MADYVTTSTSDPGQSLVQITGALAVDGNITAYYSSDINLKDNIRPIESALFKVQQIRGVTFDWNEKAGKLEQEKGHDVGLIAQEVEKVLPEVIQIRKDGIKAISYEKVVPLLVEAIKEQQVTIENLTKRIELLENGTSRRI
jgi:chaperonin cofactor prefoldin